MKSHTREQTLVVGKVIHNMEKNAKVHVNKENKNLEIGHFEVWRTKRKRPKEDI